MSQLERLARPFPDRLIHSNPSGGGSYVKHSVVTEKMLAVVCPFDFTLVEVIRGSVPGTDPNPDAKSARGRTGTPSLTDAIVGAVCRLSCEIDGRVVRVDECGDCESPHNWPHDGARLKDAMSDALKRCAMRLGVTLHLWSGAEFSLYDQLREQNAAMVSGGTHAVGGSAGSGAQTGDEQRNRSADYIAANQSPPASPASGDSSSTAEPAQPDAGTFKHKRQKLRSRASALVADNVSVADARTAVGLPTIEQSNAEELERWSGLLDDLEFALTKPFTEPATA